MGKKSRRNKTTGSATSSLQTSASATDSKASLFVNTADIPTGGWALELRCAEKAYKKNGTDMGVVLRLLESLTAMRRWELGNQVVRDVTARNLLDETDSEKLSRFKELSDELQRIIPHRQMGEMETTICRMVWDGDENTDRNLCDDGSFCNLNALQSAAMDGHVEFFERLVSLGASIDYPPRSIEEVRHLIPVHELARKGIAPPTSSALLLLCSYLAMEGLVPSQKQLPVPRRRAMKERLQGQLEIAILLVKLGADTSAVFEGYNGNNVFSYVPKKLGLEGKTAFELAKISKNNELIEVMTEYHQNVDVLKKKVLCRCGSRLPLRICHGGEVDLEKHLMREDDDGRLCFRYSPMSKCPCDHTKKTYYDCCWDAAKMHFTNDRKGEVFGLYMMQLTPQTAPMVQRMAGQAQIDVRDSSVSIIPSRARLPSAFEGKTCAEISKLVGSNIRSYGSEQFKSMLNVTRGREFEPDVYGGCIERIEDHFFWRDDHWKISKPELMLRVKEWNQALDEYCNDEGIIGQERERVLALHKASPYAPCGNPMCDKVESKVKGFSLCSRCRCVAYCSRNCQAAHWKAHKKECFV